MYKLLIVDDEYLARMGISETIDWQSLDVEVVGTATNGANGLKKVELLKPDIIISDIKMPVMDGLEFVRTLNKNNFDGLVIMLSAYNDFEYAKVSLENGVFRYLLKPIDNQELIKTVILAKEKLEKTRKVQTLMNDLSVGLAVIKAKLVDDIFHGEIDETVYDKLSMYDLPLVNSGVVIYCKADRSSLYDNHQADELYKNSLMTLEKEILNILANYKTFFTKNDKRVAFATNFKDIATLERKLIEMLRFYEKEHKVLISIGISNPFNSIFEIAPAFGTAKFLAYNKLYASLNSVSSNLSGNKIYKKHIVDALQYVSDHYSENDLKIKVVADKLFVSESYLMHLFKSELGKTFNTCLVEYRIMMAKRLLLEQKYRIYEIAEMVGYGDMKYFGQVFRKLEGCTPGEYIKKQNEKADS